MTPQNIGTGPFEISYKARPEDHRGPVVADITCPQGAVYTTVDPGADTALVQLLAEDGADSPAADIIRGAEVRLTEGRLVIAIPQSPWSGSRFFGPGGNITFQRGIEVHITLPGGSSVTYRGQNGSLYTSGQVENLEGQSDNGLIQVECVKNIKARTLNGPIKTDVVIGQFDAETQNGQIGVLTYVGRSARARSVNGSVWMSIGSSASGSIDVGTHNGSIELHGVTGRSDLNVHTSTLNGSVRKA